jgi:hypothetical protein
VRCRRTGLTTAGRPQTTYYLATEDENRQAGGVAAASLPARDRRLSMSKFPLPGKSDNPVIAITGNPDWDLPCLPAPGERLQRKIRKPDIPINPVTGYTGFRSNRIKKCR